MRRVFIALSLVLAGALTLQAAGTVTKTQGASSGNTYRATFSWLSDGSGNVSGDTTTIELVAGEIARIEFAPNSGGSQPTNLYDVTLLDEHGVDALDGLGADLSNTAAKLIAKPGVHVTGGEHLQLVIHNAGIAKGGQLQIWIAR